MEHMTTLEDQSMDTSSATNIPNPREARAKESKDRLKALLVLRTPWPTDSARPPPTYSNIRTQCSV